VDRVTRKAGGIAFGVEPAGRGGVPMADVRLGAVGATTSLPLRYLDFSEDA